MKFPCRLSFAVKICSKKVRFYSSVVVDVVIVVVVVVGILF